MSETNIKWQANNSQLTCTVKQKATPRKLKELIDGATLSTYQISSIYNKAQRATEQYR